MRPAIFAWLGLVLLGATYATFSWRLYQAAVPARAVLLPVLPHDYYAIQAIFVSPWLATLAFGFAFGTHALAQTLGGTGQWSNVWPLLVASYAWPLWVLFVVPDFVVFELYGHAALARAMPYYAPLVPVAIVALCARHLTRQHSLGRGRALVAVLVALVAQGAVGALLLR